MAYFFTRSQAAKAAKKTGAPCFLTRRDPTHRPYWMFKVVSGPSAGPDAKEWASFRDYVAWVEVAFRDGGRIPGYDSVLVITCTPDEIPAEDREMIEGNGWRIDPITPELFAPDKPSTNATRAPSNRATGEKSSVESPTKLVWEIAGTMPDAGKVAIIEACMARGITKATAQTQYYKWAKAQKG